VVCMCIVGGKVWVAVYSKILIFDIKLTLLESITAHNDKVNQVAKVGNEVWSCSDDGTIKIWTHQAEQLRVLVHSGENRSGTESRKQVTVIIPFTHFVWTSSQNNCLNIWTVKTHKLAQIMNEQSCIFNWFSKVSEETVWGVHGQVISIWKSASVTLSDGDSGSEKSATSKFTGWQRGSTESGGIVHTQNRGPRLSLTRSNSNTEDLQGGKKGK